MPHEQFASQVNDDEMQRRFERIVGESGLADPQGFVAPDNGTFQVPFGVDLGVRINQPLPASNEASQYKLHYTYFNSKPNDGHDDIEYLDEVD